MDVSIIYVNYKTGNLILDSIKTVVEHTNDISYEIIVVDNCSNDGSVKQIRQEYPQITLIESKENLGFGRANNIGAQVAKGEMLFFLNPDTLLISNSIKILVDYLQSEKDVVACGGNLLDKDGNPTNSFGRKFPTLYEEFLSIFYLKTLNICNYKSRFYNYIAKPMEVASIVGADLMIKHFVFKKIGGFSSDFFMNFEETELCFRIKKAGYKIMSVPDAEIVHLEGQSSYINASRLQRYFEGQYVFFKKKYGRKGMRQLHFIIILKCRFRKLLFTLMGCNKKKEYWQTKEDLNKVVFEKMNQGIYEN